ncbi:universal stress protein [Streptomyces sp. HB2AG]|uniref:universal stress protein n=1 Tax=Streptomyces sp. HB2AG TaxID=2983400 RepID=UPI0022AABD46|nr:universal stress protein [Streptomyces sp. HB2AG]MCZ2526553.1 universal stress protein [Streptomyces sp. HB2AG]
MAPAPDRRPVVAGVDSVLPNPAALVWAADEAHRREAPLCLVHALAPPPRGRHHPGAEAHHRSLREQGRQALDRGAALAHERYPDLEVSSSVEEGPPALVLCRQAAHAETVVLGSRGLSRAAQVVSAGSVTVPVSAQAACPVVVVREPEQSARPQQPPLVVVGVDGSLPSAAALEYAYEAAALRGAVLRAVWAWRPPRFAPTDEESAEDERRRRLAQSLAVSGAGFPGVGTEQEVVRGHPVEELVRVSGRAALLVVGRRGRGGFTGMRLGSVAHGVLRHAQCPVAVVPAPEGEG